MLMAVALPIQIKDLTAGKSRVQCAEALNREVCLKKLKIAGNVIFLYNMPTINWLSVINIRENPRHARIDSNYMLRKHIL